MADGGSVEACSGPVGSARIAAQSVYNSLNQSRPISLPQPPNLSRLTSRRLWGAVGLLLVLGVIWFGTIGHRALFQTDEGRYAEIPREMVQSGNWLTPRLDGFKYFEKPPLQYWATAVSFTLFGEHTWSARLYTTVTGFLTLLLIAFTGWQLWGGRASWLAFCVALGSLYLMLMGHFNTLDMGVTFWMTLNLAAFLLAQSEPERIARRRAYMYVSWTASALAVMSKGLIGVVLPGAVLLLYVLIQRDARLLKRLHYYGGVALFVVFGVPWFVWVTIRNPEFFHYFFIYQHFERYLDNTAHRPGPIWYFLPILLLGILPWVRETWIVLREGIRKPHVEPDGRIDAVWLLWLYAVFIFLFFSFSSSKLPSYILPIMPALALLLGHQLTRTEARKLITAILITAGIGVIGLIAAPIWITSIRPSLAVYYHRLEPGLLGVFACLLVASIVAFWLWRRRTGVIAIVTAVACGWFLAVSILNWSAQALDPIYSTRALAQRLRPWNQPDRQYYIVANYQQSLPFYLRRTLTLVHWEGEIGYGIKLARRAGHLTGHRYVPSLAEFHRLWLEEPRAVAILKKPLYQRLLKAGWPFRVVASNARRVAVIHP